MKLSLNVGLARSDAAGDNNIIRTVAVLNSYGFILVSGEVIDTITGSATKRIIVGHFEYIRHGRHTLDAARALGFVANDLNLPMACMATFDEFGQITAQRCVNGSLPVTIDPAYFIQHYPKQVLAA